MEVRHTSSGTMVSMETGSTITNTAEQQALDDAPELERMFYEINLLRLEGYYFCFDPKEASKRKGEREYIELVKRAPGVEEERKIVITPREKYGHPSPLTYKLLHAIFIKLFECGYPLPNTVYFSRREIAQLIGRKTYLGFDDKPFYNAIKQLRHTAIECAFYEK